MPGSHPASPRPPSPGSRPLTLASASARRRELLGALGVRLVVRAAEVPEPLVEGVDAAAQARGLALTKARAVAVARTGEIVLGADTIVVRDGVPLGKPATADEAVAMLRSLRGRAHDVVTGLALVQAGDVSVERTDHAVTAVHMRGYTDDEIAAYVETGAPFDRAGAYGIQDEPFRPVERLAGCYCNVMGLPLWTARALVEKLAPGTVPRLPDEAFERCATCPLGNPSPPTPLPQGERGVTQDRCCAYRLDQPD